MSNIIVFLSNLFMVLAYFFNPQLREKQEREKIWFAFRNLEEKLAQAMLAKDMYLVDRIRKWLQETRDRYSFIKDQK